LTFREKIQCTLFGSYVDELNNFLSSGETQNAAVIIMLGKVKLFQGITPFTLFFVHK
jgi:hypothetical protein